MSGYRPITDLWILGRPKVRYYGAYPSGFLERARALLGVSIDDAVLHVCSGQVRHYPYRGVGRNDRTLDVDPDVRPDYLHDCRHSLPPLKGGWPAILADPPYTLADADHYATSRATFPSPQQLLAVCLNYVRPGGRVGMLHYEWPRPRRRSAATRSAPWQWSASPPATPTTCARSACSKGPSNERRTEKQAVSHR